MKKLMILSSLVAMVVFSAQEGFSQSIKIGLKGGISLANQKLSGGGVSFKPDSKVRPHFGLFASIQPTSELAIQPELLFAGQGYGRIIGGFPEEGVNYNYLAIPIMIKYHPVSMLNIHAGPQLGFLIGGDSFNGVSVTEGAKTAELAFGFGAEVYPVEKLGLSVRYVLGLSDIAAESESFDIKNRAWQFSLLIPFN